MSLLLWWDNNVWTYDANREGGLFITWRSREVLELTDKKEIEKLLMLWFYF